MMNPKSNGTTVVVNHPESGRVYGLTLTSDDSTLYYLTDHKGLMRLDLLTNQYETVLDMFDHKLVALNSVAIDEANQVLYITDCGPIPHHYFAEKLILLGSRMGRVLKFDLKTRATTVLVDRICFPNGIIYDKNSNSIIFAEFNRHRIWKYDLSTGKKQILLENLSGYPDNLKLSDNGDLLIAIIFQRGFFQEFVKDKPTLRKYLMYLPKKLFQTVMGKLAGGIRVNPQTGEIKEYMFGATTKLSSMSAINERNGKMYFCSLYQPIILVLDKSG